MLPLPDRKRFLHIVQIVFLLYHSPVLLLWRADLPRVLRRAAYLQARCCTRKTGTCGIS